MVEQMIDKNLWLYRNRAIMETFPIDAWQYRIFDYADRETYIPLTDWADYTDTITFCDHKTCMMKTVFTPKKPQKHQSAYLELRLPCIVPFAISSANSFATSSDIPFSKYFSVS